MNVTATGNCKPGRRRAAPVPQQVSTSLQSTAWMEIRRLALPEESSERARGVLSSKRIKSFSLSRRAFGCLQVPFSRARPPKASQRFIARASRRILDSCASICNAQRAVISPNSRQPQRAAVLAALVKRRRRRKDVAPGSKIAGVPRRGRATGAAAVHGVEPQYDSKRCQKNGVARRARDAAAHRCW